MSDENFMSLGMIAAGTFLSAGAASRRKRELEALANTPGVNLADNYSDTLGASLGARSQAEDLASGVNTFNQNEVDRLIAQSIPGYQELQSQRIRNAQADLRGELSPEVIAGINRDRAAYGIDSGTSGSVNERNYGSRDVGLAIYEQQGRGAREFESIIGTTPMASPYAVQNYLNIDPRTGLALRSNERAMKLDLLTKKALSKGASETYGEGLSTTGSMLISTAGSVVGGLGGGVLGG